MSNSTPKIRWQWSLVDELSAREMHDLLRLRQQVFVVEQDCVFPDIDGRDPYAWHLLAWIDGEAPSGTPSAAADATRVERPGGGAMRAAGRPLLAGYARVFEPGAIAREAVIGRVVTAPSVRGTGVGHALMREAIRLTGTLAPGAGIRVASQERVIRFYRRHGFRPVGEPYIEDGIPHQDMLRQGGDDR